MKFFFRKDADGRDRIDDGLVYDVLAEPAPGEERILDAIRKSGGDDDVQKVGSIVARGLHVLRESYGDAGVPVGFNKALGLPDPERRLKAVPDPKPAPKPEATDDRTAEEIWKEVAEIYRRSNGERAEADLETAATALRRRNPQLTEQQAIAKALDADPRLYADYQRHRGLLPDEIAVVGNTPELEAAAEKLRKADPSLTEQQAVAKALDDDPTLYHS